LLDGERRHPLAKPIHKAKILDCISRRAGAAFARFIFGVCNFLCRWRCPAVSTVLIDLSCAVFHSRMASPSLSTNLAEIKLVRRSQRCCSRLCTRCPPHVCVCCLLSACALCEDRRHRSRQRRRLLPPLLRLSPKGRARRRLSSRNWSRCRRSCRRLPALCRVTLPLRR
jgi:hypothetical protein